MTAAEPRFLLATDTALTLLRADAPVALKAKVRDARPGTLWLSAITEAQLRSRLRDVEYSTLRSQALEILCRNVATVPFDRSAAMARAELSLDPAASDALTEAELLVAAHASSIDAVLVTLSPYWTSVTGLRTENWCTNASVNQVSA